MIDDNQVNSKSTGNANIGLDKADLLVHKIKRTPSKRKELSKASRVLHFNDMPLTPVGRLKIKRSSGGFKFDESDLMFGFLCLGDIRMEEENRKRWEENKEIRIEMKKGQKDNDE